MKIYYNRKLKALSRNLRMFIFYLGRMGGKEEGKEEN